MKVAVCGLDCLGPAVVEKLLAGGHEVIIHSRDETAKAAAAQKGAVITTEKEEVTAAFAGEPIVIWLSLLPELVDNEIQQWGPMLPKGSIIIDAGDSDFRLSTGRAEQVETWDLQLLDVGVQALNHGKNGFAVSVGGHEHAFKTIEPLFQTLAQPNGAYRFFGPSGVGHFIKTMSMAATAGMSQALAEAYAALKAGPYDNLDLAAVSEIWQRGSGAASWLNGLAALAFRHSLDLTSSTGLAEIPADLATALDAAKENGWLLPAAQAAADVRLASKNSQVNFATKLLSEIDKNC